MSSPEELSPGELPSLEEVEVEVIGAPPPNPNRVLLDVSNVTLRFGGVVALNEVNFQLYEGEILGLIGPHGAGKTTCLNVMTGVFKPTSGSVTFDDRQIA